jgi:hypothetical protein
MDWDSCCAAWLRSQATVLALTVDWLNHRRLLHSIGEGPPAELETTYYRQQTERAWCIRVDGVDSAIPAVQLDGQGKLATHQGRRIVTKGWSDRIRTRRAAVAPLWVSHDGIPPGRGVGGCPGARFLAAMASQADDAHLNLN